MKNINLEYCGTSIDDIKNKPKKKFFKIQSLIEKDFEKILYLVEACQGSNEKESLITNINKVIESICLNEFYCELPVPLEIVLSNNYLAFNYYPKNNIDSYLMDEVPIFVIVSRNMKNLYFITEEHEIFDESEEEYEYSKSQFNMEYYAIKDGKVRRTNLSFIEYAHKIISSCLHDTENYTHFLKKKLEK